MVCWFRALGCNRGILLAESAGLEESRTGQEVSVRRAAIEACRDVGKPITIQGTSFRSSDLTSSEKLGLECWSVLNPLKKGKKARISKCRFAASV